jgi:hypothetical protein
MEDSMKVAEGWKALAEMTLAELLYYVLVGDGQAMSKARPLTH